MAQRAITDDLLRTAIGLRADAGVSTSKIQKLIQRFSSGLASEAPSEEISSSADHRDVPQDRRRELLTELADLSPDPDYSPADARSVSAIDVWPCRIAEDAKMHRTALLSQTASDGSGDTEAASPPVATDTAAPDGAEGPAEETPPYDFDAEWQPGEPEDRIVVTSVSTPGITPEIDSKAGEVSMWNQGEFELIKREIVSRREEALTRHARELRDALTKQADELKVLDAAQSDLDALEQAMNAIASKFKPAADTSVVSFEDSRAMQQQAAS